MTTYRSALYLRVARYYPPELEELAIECDRAYVDTANAVNNRVIGTHGVGVQGANGEAWLLKGKQRKQGVRSVYELTSLAAMPHGINLDRVLITDVRMTYTDGSEWYGAPFASPTAVPGILSLYIAPTAIVLVAGLGAPVLTYGLCVIEWVPR